MCWTKLRILSRKVRAYWNSARNISKSEYGWSTVQEYKKSEIADDSDDEKKMFKAETRAKAHSKLLAPRSQIATSGFAPRIASVAEDSGPTPSDERYTGLSSNCRFT